MYRSTGPDHPARLHRPNRNCWGYFAKFLNVHAEVRGGWSLNGSMTRSFEPKPDLDPVFLDLAGSVLNQVQIQF